MALATVQTLVDATTIEVDPLNSNFDNLKNSCNNIIADQITDGTITNDKIADGTITSAKLASFAQVPAGAIVAYCAETPPANWLECDGSSLARTGTYADLFAVIGTAYGAADGDHFNIPDLRGKFARGWDNGAGNDPDAASRTAQATGGETGDKVGSIQGDEVESHNHTTSAGATEAAGGSGSVLRSGSGTINTDNHGGNENRPINVNVMYIIKY